MAPLDTFIVFMFVKRLFTPFREWPAFRAGIIDENGTVLKARKTLTPAEQNAFSIFDLVMLNIKRLIKRGNVPSSTMHLAPQAAAKFLMKEQAALLAEDETYLLERLEHFNDYVEEVRMMLEDAPANAVGGGAIAGTGVGPQGEPGRPRNKKKPTIGKAMEMMRRR